MRKKIIILKRFLNFSSIFYCVKWTKVKYYDQKFSTKNIYICGFLDLGTRIFRN